MPGDWRKYTTRMGHRPTGAAFKAKVNKVVNRAIARSEELKQLGLAVEPGSAQVFQQASVAVCVYAMGAVAQGTTIGTRVGNKIMLKSIKCRGITNQGIATSPQEGRIVFFRDLHCTGALPSTADILVDLDAETGVNGTIPLITNSSRFKILYDKTFTYNAQGGSTNQLQTQKFQFKKIYKANKGPILRYNGTTGAIGQVQGGQIFALFLTSVAAGASPPTCWYDLYITFADA